MKNVDYIIVGDGFAAVFFAHQLIINKKSFKIFSEGNKNSASKICAGVCNPLILKRFTKIWQDEAQMEYLQIIFSEIEKYLGTNYLIWENVVRIFHDEVEKNLWLKKSNKAEFSTYISQDIKNLKNIENPFGSSTVKASCRINIPVFFSDFFNYLKKNDNLINEKFNHKYLDEKNNVYKDISFNNIIFAEGTEVKNNPYFSEIPIQPNKGHRLSVCLEKDIDPIIAKKKHFLLKFSEDEYYYGATYDRETLTNGFDEDAKNELIEALNETYKHPYKLINTYYAFRATVPDRRPILGKHKNHKNMYIFNGLGARGVLNGSYFSKKLFDFIENNINLLPEVNIKRFY